MKNNIRRPAVVVAVILPATITLTAMPAASGDKAVRATKAEASLMRTADKFRRRCSGSEGADPSSTVCDESIIAAKKAQNAGWCWGKITDEAAYMAKWHRCGPDSFRVE